MNIMTKEEAFNFLAMTYLPAKELTREVQEKLFEIGFRWIVSGANVIDCNRHEDRCVTLASCGDMSTHRDRYDALPMGCTIITANDILSIELDDETTIGQSHLTKTPDNVTRFKYIQSQNANLYERKNADYGDSFAEGLKEYGITMAIIRLEDKLRRIKQLAKNPAKVGGESMVDTLKDLSNYAIMTIIEIEKGEPQ